MVHSSCLLPVIFGQGKSWKRVAFEETHKMIGSSSLISMKAWRKIKLLLYIKLLKEVNFYWPLCKVPKFTISMLWFCSSQISDKVLFIIEICKLLCACSILVKHFNSTIVQWWKSVVERACLNCVIMP